jgi:catechol 2,3-dioxygenase-like lactoylglutathione lyase family enzyme
MLEGFDHVNVRTADLEAMIGWYRDVLGLQPGPRPPFSFNGAWMYLGDRALVHLVEVARKPEALEPGFEHIAFRARGLGEFLARLKAGGVPYKVGVVPGFGIIQVNVWDPDGHHLHIDFAPEEKAALEGEPAA